MSSTLIFVGLPEDSKSSITKSTSGNVSHMAEMDCEISVQNSAINTCLELIERGVPNAPKSCIAEIFSSDTMDSSPVKNGTSRAPKTVRDTPTRPRDTHSRLFGQVANNPVSPMMTDNIRSHIQFGDGEMNGSLKSPSHSPSKSLMNGSASSTPSRASYAPPRRNPVTGDGVMVPPLRRRHPAACLQGADPHPDVEPQPPHRYVTHHWPPKPANYYVESKGNPITGDGYKSMNGQINTVTSINGNSNMILHGRVPPGGYSSGLW